MKELKCPKCGGMFSVDEADYAVILSQVRNSEFEKELERRAAELKAAGDARNRAAAADAQREHERVVADRDRTIAELKARLENLDTAASLKLREAEAAKDRQTAALLAARDKEIAGLNERLATSDANLKLAVSAERETLNRTVQALDRQIGELRLAAEAEKRLAAERFETMQRNYKFQLDEKDVQIEQLRDMKMRMSTKMIGESLEQHCLNEFNSMRAMAFPGAYFEKDNDATGGSKGDFIFRDFDDGEEYISIMFEMKNEMDTTATKHRNEDFFDKLDRDRKAKNCEYAVLVSLLESDSEFYNRGIVDVSYRYDKMYVIRPQFFMPVISMLARASKKSMYYKQQLKIAQSQSIDVTNFEIKLDKFKGDFNTKMATARKKYDDAISRIDSIISSLTKLRDSFRGSQDALEGAGRLLEEDLTIRKLTWANPTMREKFKEACAKAAELPAQEEN